MRARSALVLALLTGTGVSCSVGPGGSFPDTGGSASVSTTVAADTAGTMGSGTSGESTADPQDDETSAEQGTDPVDAESSGATNAEGDTTGNASADSSVSEASAESDPASSSDGGDSAPGTPLDPDLDIPDDGEQCNDPGSLVECPGISVCRFATAEYGLCESCDSCGNLNAPCTQGTECDILFSCYAGHCTNFCTLGTFECGPIEDCLDIGHPTDGVCNPFA